jgi:nucleotide-binding universal stress UspA family protein
MTFRHILVPLDFSSSAEQALECAMELVEKFQARLTLLHVIHIPVTSEVNLAAYLAEMDTSAQLGMDEYLKRVETAGHTVETIILRGTPWHEIIETAKTHHVDLIIMGTHGRTGLQHFMLGSVAEKVVRLAPCTVMVTREQAAETST